MTAGISASAPRVVAGAVAIPLCGAVTRSGGRCRKTAGWGTSTPGFGPCRLHGGATRNHRVAAARAKARLDAGQLGVETPTDAGDALDLVLGVRRGMVDALAAKVRELEELLERGENAASLHPYVRALDSALTQLAAAAKLSADMGVDERRVRVAERQAELIAGVINAVMVELIAAGLPDRFRALAGEAFKRHLAQLDDVDGTARELPGGGAA